MIWSEWIWHEPKSIKTKQNTKDCLIFAVSTLIWRKVESNNRYKYDNNHTKAIIRANDTDSPCVAFLNFSVFVIAVNQIIYYIILYESALFNRAVSEERLDLNLHSTTVSEKNIKSQKPVAAGPISENTQLSPPLTQNETFAETTEMCDFRTKTTSSSLKAKWAWGVNWNRGGPKVIRLHALSQMKFVFSKKNSCMHSYFTVVSGWFCEAPPAHRSVLFFFCFFRLLFDAEKIYLWKEEVQRKVTVPFQGTHSNIITLLSVYESSELWHKQVPAPPHSAITPQKCFLYRHSMQRARGRQPQTGVNGSRMWVWDRLQTHFSWFQDLALGDMVGGGFQFDLSDSKCSPHLLLLGKWTNWNILLVTVKEIFGGERRIIAVFFFFFVIN